MGLVRWETHIKAFSLNMKPLPLLYRLRGRFVFVDAIVIKSNGILKNVRNFISNHMKKT